MAESTDKKLLHQAELLVDIYQAPPGTSRAERFVPRRDADGRYYSVDSAIHEAIYLLVERGPNEGHPAQLRRYGETFDAVKARVNEASRQAADILLEQQLRNLVRLERRFAGQGIAGRLHKASANIQRSVGGFSPSPDDRRKARAAIGREPQVLGPQQGPDVSADAIKDPIFDAATKENLRYRIKVAMVKESAHVANKETWNLLQVIFLHPDFIDIMQSFADSAVQGDRHVRGLVVEAMGATQEFRAGLKLEPDRLWRYPPLILLGIRRLNLHKIGGFSDYMSALLPALRGASLEDVLYISGWIILLTALVASSTELGAVAAAGDVSASAAVLGLGAADLAVGIPQAAMAYVDEQELKLAATGGNFNTQVKIAQMPDYSRTKLAGAAAFLSAIALVSASAAFLRNLRAYRFNIRPVRHAARPRGEGALNKPYRARLDERTVPKKGPEWMRRPEPELDPARRMAVGAPQPDEPLAAVSQERPWLARPKSGRPASDLVPVASGDKAAKSGAGPVTSGTAKAALGTTGTAPGSNAAGSKTTGSKATIAKGKPAPGLTAKEFDDANLQQEWAEQYWAQLKSLEKKTFAHSDAAGVSSSGPGRFKVLGDFPSRAPPTGQSASEYYVKRYKEFSGLEPPRGNDTVVPGDEFATHAEIKDRVAQIEVGKNGPTGVSLDMCPACRRWYQRTAASRKETFVVDDGTFIRGFQPDGSVDIYDRSNQLIRKVQAGAPPQARSDSYYGVDW